MKEIWKPVKGYETYYEISNFGNVRSVDRVIEYSDGVKRLRKGRIIKPAKNTVGYLFCKLCKNGQTKNKYIHRLVAEAFLPNPDNLPVINHKDENKTNNRVFLNKDDSVDLDKSNLEWCTHLYNVNYGTAIQRIAEKLSRPVLQLDINTGQVISKYSSVNEAARQLNINPGCISMCCNGKRKTAYGYKWQYKKE